MRIATINIKDLKVRTIIGAYPWEKANKQELILHITIQYDASKPCRTDKLGDALNYHTVANKAVKIVKNSRYTLLEKLASRLLSGITADKRVKSARVRIDKPLALSDARCVSVELGELPPQTGDTKR